MVKLSSMIPTLLITHPIIIIRNMGIVAFTLKIRLFTMFWLKKFKVQNYTFFKQKLHKGDIQVSNPSCLYERYGKVIAMTVIILFINHLSLIIETKMSSALCVLQRSDFHFFIQTRIGTIFLMPIIFGTCDSFVSLQKKKSWQTDIQKRRWRILNLTPGRSM